MMQKNERHGAEKSANQSSDRLLQILECLAKARLPVRLQDLSVQLDMSQSTVLRYLNALQNANYIYQEASTLRYALTWKLCGLCRNIDTNLGLRSMTAPFVTELAHKLELGVCLVVEQDMECVYLDCIDPAPSYLHTLQRIGTRAPMHATGSGKVLLSQYTDAQVEAWAARSGLRQYTEHTITTVEGLLQALDQVRRTGIGMDEQECELGLRCVSAPLRTYAGTVIAAISIFGGAALLTPARAEQEVIPLLKETAALISRRLGYEPPQA